MIDYYMCPRRYVAMARHLAQDAGFKFKLS